MVTVSMLRWVAVVSAFAGWTLLMFALAATGQHSDPSHWAGYAGAWLGGIAIAAAFGAAALRDAAR